MISNSIDITILDYGDPPIEGTSITLSGLHGLILIGSNTSTCMGNGNWEPDLKRMRCNGELISIILMIKYVQFSSLFAADCGPPIASSNVSLNYSSTLEDSPLTFQCKMNYSLMMFSQPDAIRMEGARGYLTHMTMQVPHQQQVYFTNCTCGKYK